MEDTITHGVHPFMIFKKIESLDLVWKEEILLVS